MSFLLVFTMKMQHFYRISIQVYKGPLDPKMDLKGIKRDLKLDLKIYPIAPKWTPRAPRGPPAPHWPPMFPQGLPKGPQWPHGNPKGPQEFPQELP